MKAAGACRRVSGPHFERGGASRGQREVGFLFYLAVGLSGATSVSALGGRLALVDVVLCIILALGLLRSVSGERRNVDYTRPLLASVAIVLLALSFRFSPFEEIIFAAPFGLAAAFFTEVAAARVRPILIEVSLGLASAINLVVALGHHGALGRSHGIFRYPNELGFFGAAVVLLGFWSLRDLAPLGRRLLLAGAGLLLLVLAASRTPLLALIAAMSFVLAVRAGPLFRARPVASLVALAGFVIAAFSGFLSVGRYSLLQGPIGRLEAAWYLLQAPSDFFYFDNWWRGFNAILSSPVYGRGPANALVESSTLPGEFIVHNTVLNLALASGVVGLIVAGWYMGWLLQLGRRLTGRGWLSLEMMPLIIFIAPKLIAGAALNARSLWMVVAVHLALAGRRREDLEAGGVVSTARGRGHVAGT